MPFTPSHAIVALPFVRTPLVPGAMAVGAMAPDLPLFLRVGIPVGGYAVLHDARMIAVGVALALTLFLCWRLLLRPASRQLLPGPIARRLPSAWDQSASRTLRETFVGERGPLVTTVLLIVSLALGILSHIAWDAFTHEGRAGVTLLPALDEQWGPLLGYKWIQYGSGVLGVLILGVWGLLQLRGAHETAVERSIPSWVGAAWLVSLPVLLVGAVVLGYLTRGPLTDAFTVQHLAYATLPPACGVWGALTLVLCVVVAVRSRPVRATAEA